MPEGYDIPEDVDEEPIEYEPPPRVQNPDDEIGLCIECRSDQPDQYVMRQIKLGWENFPCKYCGANVRIVPRELRDYVIRIENRKRGIIY